MTATTTTGTTAATTTRTDRPSGSLWRGAGSLYAIQAANLALPLILVPYLARTLGAEQWGRVAAAQAFAMLAGLPIEFGFNLSAVRMVAQHRQDAGRLASVFGTVLTAQLVLLVASTVAAVAAAAVLAGRPPYLASDPALFASAMIWMIPQVMSLQWYFQGVEQMPGLAAWLLVGRGTGVAGVLLLVNSPQDAPLSLLLPGLTGLAVTAFSAWSVWRRLRPPLPSRRAIRQVLADGWPLCCYRAGVALQGGANSYLLAFFLPPAAVGAYAAAERLARAGAGLLDPLMLVVFPRVAHLRAQGAEGDAERWHRYSRWCAVAAGSAIAAVMFLFAPRLSYWTLGPGFADSVPVLRALALYPLGTALCQQAGLNGLVSRGYDHLVNGVVWRAGLLQIALLLVAGWLAGGSLPVWMAAAAASVPFYQWQRLEFLARQLRCGTEENA